MRNHERWMDLCQKASVEQNTEKLLQLTLEIDILLAEKETRLKDPCAAAAARASRS